VYINDLLKTIDHKAIPIFFYGTSILTLILLTTTIVAPPSNASKWQMGFNLAFKGLITSPNNIQFQSDVNIVFDN
jgi:hypothetical protein